MKTNAARFAAGLVLLSAGAPLPACAQFIYPPVLVVPPPAQNYTPKPVYRPPPRQTETCGYAGARIQGRALRRQDVGAGLGPRQARARQGRGYRIGGAYRMPPLSQSSFSPRGIPSFESAPTLRLNTSA